MTPFLQDADCALWHGDVLDVLRDMASESVDCVVTSPPYWGLRDYGTGAWEGGDEGCDHAKTLIPRALDDPGIRMSTLEGGKKTTTAQAEGSQFRDVCGKCGARRVDNQLGLEPTPDQYVEQMVEVFREVRRVLAPHGTCWINLGDSFAGHNLPGWSGLKPKDLVGIPWRVAFALQADGWWLRSDIVWAKPNPMPESVTDRPTKAHEYVFLLTKQPRYFFDQEAVREPASWERWGDQTVGKGSNPDGWIKPKGKNELPRSTPERDRRVAGFNERWDASEENGTAPLGRNIRSVWTIATQPYAQAHFATFPEELVRRCILAGCPERVCRVCGKPDGARAIRTPLGNGPSEDPTMHTGRKGMNRPRRDDEGVREIAVAEQRAYAEQLRDSPERPLMEAEAGSAFAHYVRTDDSGARPVPPHLLDEWIGRGWVERVEADGCGHSDWRAGLVLDPFVGSGTTCKVARDHGRHSIGIDLSSDYLALAATRLQQLSLLTGEAHASQ